MRCRHRACLLQSAHANEQQLLDYGDRIGRGALFKRLGYVVGRDCLGTTTFLDACHERVSKGTSLLDPGAPDDVGIASRWHLKVNAPRLLRPDVS